MQWSHDEDTPTPDPMLQEQFQIAVDATQIRTPELIEACRAVLVDQEQPAEVAEKHKIEASSIYRALGTIKAKWDEICTEQQWEYVPLAFPKSIMDVMLAFQRDLLARYSEEHGKPGRAKQK